METVVTFRTVLEVLGKPKEHVEQALKGYIEKLKKDDKFEILKEDYAEMKKQESELWATFAELEMKAKSIKEVTDFCFDYMPSIIEIVDPKELKIGEQELSEFFNDLQARLHQVDMVAKNLKLESDGLKVNMARLLKNYIVVLLGKKEMSSEELSKYTGVIKDTLEDYLDKLLDEGLIKLEKEIYSLNKDKLKKTEE